MLEHRKRRKFGGTAKRPAVPVNSRGLTMADVAECIAKLSAAGKISRKVADEALDFFNRSKAEYSTQLHSAGES